MDITFEDVGFFVKDQHQSVFFSYYKFGPDYVILNGAKGNHSP
jgi:hypothetical protein